MTLFYYSGIILLMPMDPTDFQTQMKHQIPQLFQTFCELLQLHPGSDRKKRFISFIREMIEYIKTEGIIFESSAPYENSKKSYYMLPYTYNERYEEYTDPFFALYKYIEKHEIDLEKFTLQFLEDWFFMDARKSQQMHILSRILPSYVSFSAQTVLLEYTYRFKNYEEPDVWDLHDEDPRELRYEFDVSLENCRNFLLDRIQRDSWNANAILYKIQNDLPLDTLDKTHPDLGKYRQILEEAAKKSNNRTAKAVLRLLEKKCKIKVNKRDILL